MKISNIIGYIVLVVVMFLTGVFWEKQRILESGPLELTSPLTLNNERGALGKLPEGTILYPYSHGPSINTYIVFINTKNMNLLKPIRFEHHLTVSPIDGYGE